MKTIISAESTIDMQKDLLDKFHIQTIPFGVSMGDKNYYDGEITNTEIFDFVKKNKTLPHTSAVNRVEYEEYFKKLLSQSDAVVHITLSSALSSAYENAKAVAETMENVYVIDSKTLSTGIALLAIKASEMASKGMDAKDIAQNIEALVPKVQASFVIDTLEFLYKGGRCSALMKFGANLLSIKPEMVLIDGKITVCKKFIGKIDKVVKKYCDDIIAKNPDVDLDHAFVTYSSATPEMVSTATEALKVRGFKNIYITTANATVSCHCGPKTLGILFINK